MAKQITFEYEGKNYVLEFTRKSVKTMEQGGFNLSEVKNKPVSLLPELFAGAFLAHHRFADKKVINEIYDQMTNKDELIEILIDMYNDTLVTVMGGTEETEGNISWKAMK
ncbi:MAG: DUF5055 domain-containing protein [Eubacterium sp.]